MKRIPLYSLLAFLLTVPAQAQEPASGDWRAPSHLIAINPLQLLFGKVSLEYEQGLGRHVSLLFTPSALVFPGLIAPSIDNLQAYGLQVGLHIFPGGNALNGFWMGPEVYAAYAVASNGGLRATGYQTAVQGALGYTFIIGYHLGLSLGVGAGWTALAVQGRDQLGIFYAFSENGLSLSGRLSFGYAF
ncbi:MAG: hypothetical protein ACKVPX_12340 [Myxococcaceae bacterium]